MPTDRRSFLGALVSIVGWLSFPSELPNLLAEAPSPPIAPRCHHHIDLSTGPFLINLDPGDSAEFLDGREFSSAEERPG